MSKFARKTLAECKLTPAGKRKLAKLAERPDSEIDFSDIPPLAFGKTQFVIPSTAR
jgi:hypothetical protein